MRRKAVETRGLYYCSSAINSKAICSGKQSVNPGRREPTPRSMVMPGRGGVADHPRKDKPTENGMKLWQKMMQNTPDEH